MRRVYVEPIKPPFTADGKKRHEVIQERMQEALERALERAAPDFTAPVQAVSITMTKIDTTDHAIIVLVEEAATGFRPLGT